jgi:hypothetical protein
LTIAEQQGADADFSRLMGVVLAGRGDPGAASLRDGLDYALTHQLQLDPTAGLGDAPPAIAEHIKLAPPPPPPPPPPGVAAPDHVIAPPPASEADVLADLAAAKTPAQYDAAAKARSGAIDALVAARTALSAPIQLAFAAVAAGDLASAQAIRASLVQDTIPGAGAGDLALLDATLAVASGRPDAQILERLADLGGASDATTHARAQAAAALFTPFAGTPSPAARAAIAGFDLGPSQGPLAAFLALDLSADASAKGDVAMLTLSLAELGGRAGPTPADRVRIERALSRAGLDADARGFAIEGLIALQRRS